MSRTERSAGVIVFRSSGTSPPQRLYLLLDYGRYWDYAKGHVEKGETDRDAALRELHEETGIDSATLLPDFAHEITYFFRTRRRGVIRKTVVFFLARTDSDEVTLSREHVGFAFLPYPEAKDRLTYANAKELLRLADEHADALSGQNVG